MIVNARQSMFLTHGTWGGIFNLLFGFARPPLTKKQLKEQRIKERKERKDAKRKAREAAFVQQVRPFPGEGPSTFEAGENFDFGQLNPAF